MTIEFLPPHAWIVLSQLHVEELLVQVKAVILAAGLRYGNVPLRAPLVEEYRGLRLVVGLQGEPTSADRILYSELDDALKGFWMKLIREGFQPRRCRYRRTQQPAGVEWMGNIWLMGFGQ